MPMNPEVKEKWLRALRSGEYEQGRSRLRGPDGGFCCWGVLCDVLMPDGWGDDNTHCGEEAMPNMGILAEAGIPSVGGSLVKGPATQLASLNDWTTLGFPEIADYIEREL